MLDRIIISTLLFLGFIVGLSVGLYLAISATDNKIQELQKRLGAAETAQVRLQAQSCAK